MNAVALKTGMVRGITRSADQFEVAVKLGADQWVIARLDAQSMAAYKLAIGGPVLVDTSAQPIALRPREERA